MNIEYSTWSIEQTTTSFRSSSLIHHLNKQLLQTYHIHINGIVQGVGFRPMVYQLATQWKLDGFVKNDSDGLHIYVNTTAEIANRFFNKIISGAPVNAVIIAAEIILVSQRNFNGFSILVADNESDEKQVLISPDVALCESCRGELHDPGNRRFRYPFITCTECGPRYSIIRTLPYERHGTSMQSFSMCSNCREEYENVTERRFFSQTNSCDQCGIKLSIWGDATSLLSCDTNIVLSQIKQLIGQGKIIAVKGVGGYLLLCDAANKNTIQLLRNRKLRPRKPFAVLYPGINRVQVDFELNNSEQALLQGRESPILLLYPKPSANKNLELDLIAPGLKRVGVMIPYSPLLELVANDFGKPMIATSANISGSPIIYKDEEALGCLFDIADFIVTYNREIIVPQDDSVVQVTGHSNLPVILRRSRGYAPSYLHYQPIHKTCTLSTGAFLKSSFCLSVNGNVFISQFLGSGESYESQEMYKTTLAHWLDLYQAQPAIILTDTHPHYFSHQYAIELGEKLPSEIKFIQHHEAHFAAVLAEHQLFHLPAPVLGIIWDGTGLGTDGNIWGGEFFKYDHQEILRCYHFDYFPAIAGDKMALEPRISALCTTNGSWPFQASIKEKFTTAEWNTYQALVHATQLYSSSVGRIFDAVASLLGICDIQSYEGEAALQLQVLAETYVAQNGFLVNDSYFKEGSHYYRIPTASLIQGILEDLKKGKAKNYIAAKFHCSLVALVGIVATNVRVDKICFSGGVFQNALLVDWIQLAYGHKYQLYFHQHLSPNDENISFGQMVYYDNKVKSIIIPLAEDNNISRAMEYQPLNPS